MEIEIFGKNNSTHESNGSNPPLQTSRLTTCNMELFIKSVFTRFQHNLKISKGMCSCLVFEHSTHSVKFTAINSPNPLNAHNQPTDEWVANKR